MPRLVNLANFTQFAAVNLSEDLGLIPGPKIVSQCAQITLRFSLESGKVGHVVLGGRYVGAFSSTVATATAIHTGLSTGGAWTALAAFLAASTQFIGVDIRNIAVKDQAILSSSSVASPGTSASPALPNEVALALTLRTASTGPRYRGRAFIPGWATNALGAGNIAAAAAVTALNNWQGTVGGVFGTSGFTWVLALPARNAYTSPMTGRAFDARPQESPAIISASPNNHWDSQRRRGLK
jgi:hypothetical protein